MKIGDLVAFKPEASITEERPVGIVLSVGVDHGNGWDTRLRAVTAIFPGVGVTGSAIGVTYSCKAKDFEIVSSYESR